MIDVRGIKFVPKKIVNDYSYENVHIYEGMDGERYVIHAYDDDRKKFESVRSYIMEQKTNYQVSFPELAEILKCRRSDLVQVSSESTKKPRNWQSVTVQRLVDDLDIRFEVESLKLWEKYN